MAHDVRFLLLESGIRLPYLSRGRRSGFPVLFLHGFAGSWRTFELSLPLLPETLFALAPTLRGHAGATSPNDGYGLRDFASDVVGFLDGLDLDHALVIGHSMGAAIALRLALDHPERVRGLVLAAGSIPAGPVPPLATFYRERLERLEDPVGRQLADELIEGAAGKPLPGSVHAALLEDALQLQARVWKEAFRSRLATDMRHEVSAVVAPTLLLWGDADPRVSRGDQQGLLDAIPHAELRVYPGIGHGVPYEAPDRFAWDVVEFARSALG